jgi:hypothetical protein
MAVLQGQRDVLTGASAEQVSHWARLFLKEALRSELIS